MFMSQNFDQPSHHNKSRLARAPAAHAHAEACGQPFIRSRFGQDKADAHWRIHGVLYQPFIGIAMNSTWPSKE